MTTPDHGVDPLLRQTARDLALPDVDRLVAQGVTLGRARRRRARIGTAVASVALVGATAAVVPQLVGGDPQTARDARPVQPATSVPALSGDPDVAPTAEQLRPLVPLGTMADGLGAAVRATRVEPVPQVDDGSGDLSRLYHLTVEGAQVSFWIRWYNSPVVVQDGGRPLAPSHICEPAVEDDCTTLADGSRLLREEAYPSGGTGVPETFLQRSLTLATPDGWQISVIARNSTAEKEGAVVADEPVLTMGEMQALAMSTAWYA